MINSRQLYRSREHRIIGGVAGGLAEYFQIDVTLIRLLWILAVFFGGGGVLAYLIAWLIIPDGPTITVRPNETPGQTTPTDYEAPVAGTNSEAKQRSRQPIKLNAVGWLLIGLGLFLLLKNCLPWYLTKYVWPLLLISCGCCLLIKHPRL